MEIIEDCMRAHHNDQVPVLGTDPYGRTGNLLNEFAAGGKTGFGNYSWQLSYSDLSSLSMSWGTSYWQSSMGLKCRSFRSEWVRRFSGFQRKETLYSIRGCFLLEGSAPWERTKAMPVNPWGISMNKSSVATYQCHCGGTGL